MEMKLQLSTLHSSSCHLWSVPCVPARALPLSSLGHSASFCRAQRQRPAQRLATHLQAAATGFFDLDASLEAAEQADDPETAVPDPPQRTSVVPQKQKKRSRRYKDMATKLPGEGLSWPAQAWLLAGRGNHVQR